jgi:acyl transferase domain-containing protein
MLETGLIPPNIHFNTPNPNIQWDKWNVTVPTELTTWPTDGVRRISVNSFGYGGSNGHVVLDDAYHYLAARKLAINGHSSNSFSDVNRHLSNGVNGTNGVNGKNGVVAAITNGHTPRLDCPRPRLFVWSAQDKDGLKRIEQPLSKYIQAKIAGYQTPSPCEKNMTGEFMARLAYTLGERRSRLQWKTYAIASSPEELTASLTASSDERHTPVIKSSRSPRLGFVFTGQGAQWPRMGVELMVYKVFRNSLEAADKYLREKCGCAWSVMEELQKNKATSPINQALYSHGLTCVLQIALVDLLRSWNILPTAVVGHSGGEIAASYASGGLTKQDAWKVAYYRGYVASRLKLKAPEVDGAMMAVGLSSDAAQEWIAKVTDGDLVVACINSPTSTTIAGDRTGIDQLLGMLQATNIFAKKLFVDTAYHSPHMAYGAEEYCGHIADIKPIVDPVERCAMYSTVTGNVIEPGQLGVDHWLASITGPVLFSVGVYDVVRPFCGDKRQTENAVDILLEVGPHSVLQGPSTQSLKAHGITNVPYYSVLTRNVSGIDTAVNTAGTLFTQGCQINIREVNADGHMRFDSPLVDLPTYSWNHSQRFWHDSRVDNEFLSRHAPKPGILGARWPSVTEGEQLWKGFLRLSEAPWIADHKIQGSILYPGAGYIAMAIEAAVQTTDRTREIAAFSLRDIQFTAAGIMSDDADLECIVQLRPHVAGTRDSASTWTQFTVTTSPDGTSLVQNCRGLILIEYQLADGSDASRERSLEQQGLLAQYEEAQQTCAHRLDTDEFYADMRSWGLEYGPHFANVCEARNNRVGQSVGAVKLPEAPIPGVSGRPYVIHPGTLDAVFHLAFAAVKGGQYDPTTAMVPRSIDAVTISANIPFEAGTVLPGFSNADRHGLSELNADIIMLDGSTHLPTIVIEGFLCAEIAGASASVIPKSLTGKLTWKPAISLLAPEDLASILSRQPNGEAKLVEVCVKFSLLYVGQTVYVGMTSITLHNFLSITFILVEET